MSDAKHAGGGSSALVETVAGLSAGTMAVLIVHPLDIIKTRMQIHRSTAGHSAPLSAIAVARSLLQTPHPVAALYRGLAPNLVGNATSWASFFFFKSRAERAILALKAPAQPSSPPPPAASASSSSSSSSVPAAPRLTAADYFVASALAGVGVQVLTNPIWVLKTRMVSSDRSAAGAYPGMLSGARQLLREEGWRGFYRGLGISLFGVSHGAVQFAVYEPAKRWYTTWRQGHGGDAPREDAGGRQRGVVTNEATLVLSTASKLTAGAVTYPYQVVRSRLQNYDAEARFGKGITGVVARLWREEGWRGFYRGLMPGVIRVLPATWVTFLVYENVKYYLPQWLE
ncbi:hypothetical protein NKR23_g6346 [Pleurostoma richardsiae]|uniref:Uncharacterized protein n=1 Tax=Pleurostoma richardsiae TaxID=41990 RepID=A0AA38RPK9_9PEZI|nr:hypothetical protein NKR23_g6346 [Pleurostoma richardsiae]